MTRGRRSSRNPIAYVLACIVLAGAAVAVYELTRPSHPAPVGPTPTTGPFVPSRPSPRFVAGTCAGVGCTQSAIKRYNLNVVDSDAIGCRAGASCGTPAIVAPDIYISRPHRLSDAPAPLLIAFSGSVPGDPNWLAASATGPAAPYVYVEIPPEHDCARVCVYAHPTVDVAGGEPEAAGGIPPHLHDCGVSRTLTCDDAPLVAAVITAIERCTSRTSTAGGAVGSWVAAGAEIPPYGQHPRVLHGNGAPPCEHVNPREVFVEGGSKGGVEALDTACDTRTSRLAAGITDVSERVVSTGPTASTPPNCPALLGVGRDCAIDCVPRPPNTRISLQWIWGSADPAAVDSRYCAASDPSADCLGVGYAAGSNWAFGNSQLASATIGGHGLGCGAVPVSAGTTGTTGKITVRTYAHCRDPDAAVQTVDVYGGQHLPDTWPTNRWPASGIICTSGCRDRNRSDGLVEPLAAWSFWTTYFP